MAFTVPLPRAPLEGDSAQWYEKQLGWATAAGPPGEPVQLLTGLRFDVLELPADAGAALLRRVGATGPVALGARSGGSGGRAGEAGAAARMWLLVAAGSAEELPGLLDWLEWGAIALDLTAHGAGGRVRAPAPPREPRAHADAATGAAGAARGAAGWLRSPEPGREVEPTLPAIAPFGSGAGNGGSGGDAPDLVRLVDAAATECHRARLLRGNTLRTNTQPLAFS
jgi:hypothetical protein